MKIACRPYTCEWEPAVAEFNRRLAPQRMPVVFRFPERCTSDWLPPRDGSPIRQEYFLAVDGDATVRGGYILKTQDFWIEGRVEQIGNLQLPLSEGIVDPRYGPVGVHIVLDALRRQPRLYSLGMGGLNNPYPRLLKGLKWSLSLVPFHFRLSRPGRVLKGLPALRTSRRRGLAADVLALTGTGWLGARLQQGWAGRRRRGAACRCEPQPGFGEWIDEVWEAARGRYTLTPVRDRAALEALYGEAFRGLIILKMTRGRSIVGWASVLDTSMAGHRYFGDLRVGTIVDGFAAPGDAAAVIRAATAFLEGRGVDLIVSNQSHAAWVDGLGASGFLKGLSNFALAFAKGLAAALPSGGERWGEYHFNRGDGDGPINL
jgi:hypothetical protein